MRILPIMVLVMITIVVGETEAIGKKRSTVDNAIKEGLAAICRELPDHIWREESEQCIQLVTVTRDKGETMSRDEE